MVSLPLKQSRGVHNFFYSMHALLKLEVNKSVLLG